MKRFSSTASLLLVMATMTSCSHLTGESRFGVPEDRRFPHDTPEELIVATLALLENGQCEYMVVHLMNPLRIKSRELCQEVLNQFHQSPEENWRDALLNLHAIARGEIHPEEDGDKLRYRFDNAGGDITILEVDGKWYIDNI